MPYAAQQDAIDLYGSTYVLTSVTRDEVPDVAALDRAFVKASGLIDSFAGAQYTVPLASTPDIVVQYCVDIGIYYASADAGTGTDEKRKRYEDAIEWLKMLAKGTVVIDSDGDGATDSSAETESVEYAGPTRAFTRTTMSGL